MARVEPIAADARADKLKKDAEAKCDQLKKNADAEGDLGRLAAEDGDGRPYRGPLRPAAVVRVLHVHKLRGVGVSTASGDAAELGRLVPVEYERIGKLIKTANIKPD